MLIAMNTIQSAFEFRCVWNAVVQYKANYLVDNLIYRDVWLPLARERFLHPENTNVSTIDEDLDELADVLQRGRERRNSMVPAARLPSEVLANIFEYAKHEYYGEYEDIGERDREGQTVEDEQKIKVMGWNTFSYVCRRWRQVRVPFFYF
jgi:hypothetical protein